MKNTIKVIFLGIVGFALLVYLTAPEQKVIDKSKTQFLVSNLPTHFEIVGKNHYVKRAELLEEKKYFIVLNHDSLILANKLNDLKDVFLVANISTTPWFMKKLAVNGKLEELTKDSTLSLVNDSNGEFVKAINLNDIKQNSYFIYKIEASKISLYKEGNVDIDALQKGMSKENLDKLISNIKKVI